MQTKEGELYLPTDLGQMINYLDNKYKSNTIKSSIQMDRVPNLSSLSQSEVK